MPNFSDIIQVLILILVLGAAWFLFRLGADYIGLPPVVMTVLTVLIVVFLIVIALRFLQGKLQ